jgi:hypothetical protein
MMTNVNQSSDEKKTLTYPFFATQLLESSQLLESQALSKSWVIMLNRTDQDKSAGIE